MLADPRILILDEATSSLDSESEALIRDGLRSLRHGRTTFVIAHRLSTIESADQILVLEHGEIVERGTHGELIELGGRYRQLYEKQYGAEKDEFINPGEDFTRVGGKERVRKDLTAAGPRAQRPRRAVPGTACVLWYAWQTYANVLVAIALVGQGSAGISRTAAGRGPRRPPAAVAPGRFTSASD